MPTLVVVDPGQREFTALCDDCVRERAHGDPERLDLDEPERAEVCIRGELALDCASGTGECAHGHPYRVVREGSGGDRH